MTEDEFDAFYATAFPRLTGQLYAFTGDHGEAQDVVQEAFVRAWDRRRTFLADEAPEAWIRTVATRLAVSRWRRARRWLELVRRSPQPTTAPGPDPEHIALVAALRQLPEAQRMAIVLHHLCDLSVAQVAVETGARVGTVKARLSRGRSALAELLRTDTQQEAVEAANALSGATTGPTSRTSNAAKSAAGKGSRAPIDPPRAVVTRADRPSRAAADSAPQPSEQDVPTVEESSRGR